MSVALASTWIIGYAIGVLVVIIAAALLLAIIGLGRRIVGQAEEITKALDGARSNTDALFDVKRTNLALDRITRGLAAARGAQAAGADSPAPAEDGADARAGGRLSRVLHRGRGADTE